MTFTAQQKLEAVERELGFRRRVYERRVADKKMSQQKADHEIAIFEAIADDYREKAWRHRQQPAHWNTAAVPRSAPGHGAVGEQREDGGVSDFERVGWSVLGALAGFVWLLLLYAIVMFLAGAAAEGI